MQITIATTLLVSLLGSTAAFAPHASSARAFAVNSKGGITQSLPTAAVILHMAEKKAGSDKSLDDEVDEMVSQELVKTKKMSNLRNPNGVEYAPWMNISKEDETKIRQMSKDKAVARRKRQEQEQSVQGALLKDSQAQELSGTGLRFKLMDQTSEGSSVELEWATAAETSTQGFIIKRRPAKTEDFDVLASFEDYGPLASKGPDGGVYRYLDTNVAPGGWVYRVTEREGDGSENDLSQCLVDVTTEEEQRGAVIALVGLGIVAAAAVFAGTMLDPMQ
jgi:hypothetical protein